MSRLRLFCHALPAILVLLLSLPGSAQITEDDLLPVEEAFALSAAAAGTDAVRLRWNVAEGYYLYRERISVRLRDSRIEIGELLLPPGTEIEDEFFGRVQTYRGVVEALLPLNGAEPNSEIELDVRSQGCADIGVCYPPHSELVRVRIPPAAQAAPVAVQTIALDGKPGSTLIGAGTGLRLPGVEQYALPEEQAFVVEIIATDARQLLARWSMPDGYYLYRERSGFRLAEGEGVALGAPQWPRGVNIVDEHFGDSEVYYRQVEVALPLVRSGLPAQRIAIDVEFQGCLEDGICYPPMERRIAVELPALDGMPDVVEPTRAEIGPVDEPIPMMPEQDRLAAALAGPNTALTLLTFFGLGLLLAFTPCVFPMVPILSGIIAGQGKDITTGKALLLSLVYVLAMALTYTAFGVIAGLSGYNLQATFQNPWVLTSFALVFVLLSLAMFGLFELQVPAAVQNRLARMSNSQSGGTLGGVALMGLLSALIVGPCVAPPLMGALIYISQSGDPVLGGAALFSLSMGMGAPLVVWGASAGRLLPRAGAWMDAIKQFFGVLLLLVALYLMERVLDPIWIMLLLGALLIACGVHLGAIDRLPRRASGWLRTGKAFGVILLVLGVIQLLGVAAGGRDWMSPLSSLSMGSSGNNAIAAPQFTMIKSSDELNAELLAASARGQPVMLDFYADWCTDCKRMERYTFSDPAVVGVLDQARLLKADVTANDAVDQELLRRFGLIGPPAILFFDAAGQEVRAMRTVGFVRATDFVAIAEAGFSMQGVPCQSAAFC